MLSFKKILAPTDFSEASYDALEWARDLALHFDAELYVLYVVPPVPRLPPDPNYAFELPGYEDALQANAEERLRETIEERLGERVRSHPMIGFGEAAAEIVHLARENGFDLIVISTHGLTGWRHLVFGSVAEKVVRLASCPVLTVRVRGPREA